MVSSCRNPKWIGDGSEGGTIDVRTSTASTSITFASATQGTPFNIRLDTNGAPMGKSYYEIKVSSMSEGASLGIGLVTPDGFQPGWGTKGCFYNGNITNGSAGLITGFGKVIKEGDAVGVYHQRSDNSGDDTTRRCNIIFFHNGRCLGAGFSSDDNKDRFLFPCLNLSGSATVGFSVPPSPTVHEREQAVQNANDPYGGDWVIDQAFAGPELAGLPLPAGSTLKVSFEKISTDSSIESNVQYQLLIKISNSLRSSFAITGKMEAFDKIEFLSPCWATRMRPRPDFAKLEQLIQTAMGSDGGWRKMIVTEKGQLIMSGPTVEIICSRYVGTFEPVRSF